jgi:hypothetical protein
LHGIRFTGDALHGQINTTVGNQVPKSAPKCAAQQNSHPYDIFALPGRQSQGGAASVAAAADLVAGFDDFDAAGDFARPVGRRRERSRMRRASRRTLRKSSAPPRLMYELPCRATLAT